MNKYVILIILFFFSCSGNKKTELLSIPETVPTFKVLINKGEVFQGYIMLRKIIDPGAQLMINSDGKVVWFQLSDTALYRPFKPLQDSYIALYNEKEIHEVSYNGDTLLNLKYGDNGFDKTLHHEITIDADNNIVALTKEVVLTDLSLVGGNKKDTIVTDGIIKLDRAGAKLWSWSLHQHIDPTSYPNISNVKHDWGHANALFIDDDGNYLVSWRDFDQIWKINSTTGSVMWKYGASTIKNEKELFYKQHTIHKNLDEDYMFFDNGHKSERKTSRAVAFQVKDGKFEQTMSIELPDSLFSSKQGSVYQIEDDKFLFSSPMKKYITVTNRDGELLWLVQSDEPFYRAEYIEDF